MTTSKYIKYMNILQSLLWFLVFPMNYLGAHVKAFQVCVCVYYLLMDFYFYYYVVLNRTSLVALRLQCGRRSFGPWVGKIPWRRKWKPNLFLLALGLKVCFALYWYGYSKFLWLSIDWYHFSSNFLSSVWLCFQFSLGFLQTASSWVKKISLLISVIY